MSEQQALFADAAKPVRPKKIGQCPLCKELVKLTKQGFIAKRHARLHRELLGESRQLSRVEYRRLCKLFGFETR